MEEKDRIDDAFTRMMLKDARIACTFQHPVSLGMPNTSISGCKSITLFFVLARSEQI
jgi:hypothetical protein